MPSANTVIDILLGADTKELTQVTSKVRTEDKVLIENVFPEGGVLTYLGAVMFKKIADELRSEGITSISDRYKSKRLKTLNDLASNVQIRKK